MDERPPWGFALADSLDVSHEHQVSCGSSLGRLLWRVRPAQGAQPAAQPLSPTATHISITLGSGRPKYSSAGPTPGGKIRISGGPGAVLC